MRGIHLVPDNTKLDFVSKKMIFYIFSVCILLASGTLFGSNGLNYGIDFQGGIVIEVKTPGPADIGKMRSDLSSLGIGEVALQEFGAPDEVLIRIQKQDGAEKAQQEAINQVKEKLGESVEYRRTEFVGPKVSQELLMSGVYAVSAAIFAILVYIWFRFEWQFGVGAVVALTHDVLTTIGLFALTGFEFNLSTVAAILTIAGYSINDTVVVFDRVRENLRRYKSMDMPDLLNRSINETLSRTVMTSLTTLMALIALYILGGEVIRGFSFAMIWGVLVGTYSSVCLAVPMLLLFDLRRKSEEEKNKDVTPDFSGAIDED